MFTGDLIHIVSVSKALILSLYSEVLNVIGE